MARSLCSCALLAALAGCLHVPASTDAPRRLPPAAPSAGLACTPFQWVELPGVSRRALIRVPATVGGERAWLQLDTGADATILYRDAGDAEARQWPLERRGAQTWARTRVELGAVAVPSQRVLLRGRARSAFRQGLFRRLGFPVLDGTAGLDLLAGRVTLLDFPNQRLCVLGTEPLPAALERRTTFSPAELRQGKLFVDVRLGGEPVAGLIFDTGSSRFPLLVDLTRWQALTGRTGSESTNQRVTATSWGKRVTFVGAPATGALEVGGLSMPQPTVFYRTDDPAYFANAAVPMAGLFGNAPVWNHAIVLDLRPGRQRFGVVR